MAPPPLHILTEAEKNNLLLAQYEMIARMLARGSYFGTGSIMADLATKACERIVRIGLGTTQDEISFDVMVELLAVSRSWFDGEYGDEDGFGTSTYGELINHIIGIQICHTGRAVFSDDRRRALGCFDVARLMETRTQRRDLQRTALRYQIMISKRLGDEDAVDRIVAQLAQGATPEVDFESFLDALACGIATIGDCKTDLAPYQLCRARFWEGAGRKSDGDPEGHTMLRQAPLVDFDLDECVLAGADLNIPWNERILRKRCSQPTAIHGMSSPTRLA